MLAVVEEVEVVVVAGATQPLDSAALGRLRAFVDAGGAALVLLEPVLLTQQSPMPIPVRSGLEPWLEERGESEIAHAISAHYTRWGVPHETVLDRALLACDELTGFVVACCLVRPDGVVSLTPKSVRKKLKDKCFAAKVERSEVQAGVEGLGVELADHVQFVIDALREHVDELGIGGSAPSA